MSYSLEFVESALKEWRKLAPNIREQFKDKLAERLQQPHVPSARLHSMKDCNVLVFSSHLKVEVVGDFAMA